MPIEDTVTVTLRVITPMPGWSHGQEVTVERTEFVDRLLDAGRVVLVDDPESAAHDQGDDPDDPGSGEEHDAPVEAPVEASAQVTREEQAPALPDDGDESTVEVHAYRRKRPAPVIPDATTPDAGTPDAGTPDPGTDAAPDAGV